MKKEWTDEERKAFAEKMKEAREKNQVNKSSPNEKEVTEERVEIQSDESTDDLKRQVEEMKRNMEQMQALLLNTQKETPPMNRSGDMIGEWVKYLVDPALYPDPTPRLRKEPRLQPLAFDYNYEISYNVGISSYETKSGRFVKEPKFEMQLERIVLDDQGNQTDKRWIVKKLIFHEDPSAAMVIARENGLEVDKSDEKRFLNEMRYYRVRDWLFDIFWAKGIDAQNNPVKEEVIGGSVVQVYTKSSVESSGIPFDQLTTKL